MSNMKQILGEMNQYGEMFGEPLTEAVKRSKSRAIVKTMDEIKADLTGMGFKHQQMGSVDLYERHIPGAVKSTKKVVDVLKKHGILGFHNKEDDENETKWTFEHKRNRHFLVYVKVYKDKPDDMYIHVQDQA